MPTRGSFDRTLRLTFAALLVAFGVESGSRACADDPPVATADDGLVALLLDGPAETRDALEEALETRGSGGKEALARARRGADAQRSWLAEAYATRIASESDLPEMRKAFARASRVLRVFFGLAPGDDGSDPEKAATRRAADARAMLAEGDERALPWVEAFADDVRLPHQARFDCARALVVRKRPRAIGRLERVLEECPTAHRPWELVEEIAATGTAEVVPLLLRARALVTSIGDGHTTPLAEKAIERLRTVPGFAEAYAPWFTLVRRYEAEEAPLQHSTGALVAEGWQVKAGRDRIEHMVYGPYVTDLPREELVARFRWRIDAAGEKPPDPLLTLEVTSEEAQQRWHWPIQTVRVESKSAPLGEWRETDMTFWPHPAPARMEFRVHWKGACDATVDRIDIVRVRAREAADRALDPPRAVPPWLPAPAATPAPPVSTDVARALFDTAYALARAPRHALNLAPPVSMRPSFSPLPPPGAWVALRDLLLASPSAPEVLSGVVHEKSADADRAWLADAWRVRLDHGAAWDDLARQLDTAFAWLLVSTSTGHILGGVTPRRHEEELAEGKTAVAIEGVTPPDLPEGFTWAHALPEIGFWKVDRPALGPLPRSELWRAIFAEAWILGPRGPLRSAGWNLPASPRRSLLPVVPCSSGVFRLHALQQLSWLGEARICPALEALRADAAATPAEREIAKRCLAALPK